MTTVAALRPGARVEGVDGHPHRGPGTVEHVSMSGRTCMVLFDCGCRELMLIARLRPTSVPAPACREPRAPIPRLSGMGLGAGASYLVPGTPPRPPAGRRVREVASATGARSHATAGASWSRHHAACTRCGSTERPHASRGLCKRCYAAARRREAGMTEGGSMVSATTLRVLAVLPARSVEVGARFPDINRPGNVLSQLAARGFAERRPAPDKANASTYHRTPKGDTALARARAMGRIT